MIETKVCVINDEEIDLYENSVNDLRIYLTLTNQKSLTLIIISLDLSKFIKENKNEV